MSRHRNVRSMDYNDEYDGYDDVYGHSVEDDSCISPSDAAQWLYDRARGAQHGIESYLEKDIPEEDEDLDDQQRRDSINLPELSSLDKARLASCLEGIRNVIGDTVPERVLAETVIKHDFDLTTSLDAVLNNTQETVKTRGDNIADLKLNDTNFKKPMSLMDLMKSSNRQSNLSNRLNSQSLQNDQNTKQTPEQTKFNSLNELASFHLNNTSKSPSTNKFVIPKLNFQSKTHDLPKQKSLELENWHIDLSSALKSVSTEKTKQISEDNKMDVDEDFVPQFVDCEMIEEKLTDLDPCCLNMSHILDVDIGFLKKHPTQFAKILCRQYKPSFLPKVEHTFDILQEVQCFKFDIPSPDDSIQKYVRK